MVRRLRPCMTTTTPPGNNARVSCRQHRETLGIVGAARYLHLDPLALVQLQLILEDLLVEGVLQVLVGEIDQQLLELVAVLEVFEAFSATCQEKGGQEPKSSRPEGGGRGEGHELLR